MLVQVEESELKELRYRSRWLTCLENAGVDNWEGYDYAAQLKRELGISDPLDEDEE